MMERGLIYRSNRSPAARGLADPLVMFEAPLFVGLLGVRSPIWIRLLPVTDFLDDGLRRAAKKLRVLLREPSKGLPNCSPLFSRQARTQPFHSLMVTDLDPSEGPPRAPKYA